VNGHRRGPEDHGDIERYVVDDRHYKSEGGARARGARR
jgi:hypothetical protein